MIRDCAIVCRSVGCEGAKYQVVAAKSSVNVHFIKHYSITYHGCDVEPVPKELVVPIMGKLLAHVHVVSPYLRTSAVSEILRLERRGGPRRQLRDTG